MPVDWNDTAFRAAVHRGAAAGLFAWANVVEAKAVDLILNTAKSGRVYRRRGVEHRASGPGEPPASDTGRLLASHRVEVSAESLWARVMFSTRYAVYLELGTFKMEPRPFLSRALTESFDQGFAAFQQELRAATA